MYIISYRGGNVKQKRNFARENTRLDFAKNLPKHLDLCVTACYNSGAAMEL
jgi:hypothetical protein